ncbi:hypothetical protein V7793_18200 [Streptomyces sp. KLMMK]|uniref:hypothetical protein n=1 Tax=Streptomyces sp. KLMMK TaxID=3109353 RepID=UPI00300AD228
MSTRLPVEADDKDLADLLLRAARVVRQESVVDVTLRTPLAEWLEDAADGDDEGVISPYAEAVARAVITGQPGD